MSSVSLMRYTLVLLLAAGVIALSIPRTYASALSGESFNPGRIIDDSVFFNVNSMTPTQIQNFLNAKVPTCWRDHPPYTGGSGTVYYAPFICLSEYQENTTTKENNLGRLNPNGTPYTVQGGKTAAQIIWDAAQEHGINPQVLIVMLQKEQGLVTDTWPVSAQFKIAMGYACPDTAPCNEAYYGFYNQVSTAAWQLRRYITNPDSYNFKSGVNRYIQYNPSTACGGTTVFIENNATAALYNYTPYQPNRSALDNLYGTGDSCSAYGNRNFWRMFNDWFGSTLVPYAFKTSTSPNIYMYAGGYKMVVGQMAVMQDYGISPDSIQTISQSNLDSIPSPTVESGVSTAINYIVKSPSDSDGDGGSIYIVSRGKRYQVKTMDQFYGFNLKESSISYAPLNFIKVIPSGGQLSNFVQSPYGNVFYVNDGSKRLYFEYTTYKSDNPGDTVTPLSYYITDRIPSGDPIIDKPTLVKRQGSERVSLLYEEQYYAVPDYGVYSCWGFDKTQGVPVHRVIQNNYIGAIVESNTLDCVEQSDNKTYVLNGSSKYVVPDERKWTTTNSGPPQLFDKLPTRTEPLKQYVKSKTSAAVWSLESGQRRLVPTYRNFILLGLSSDMLDVVDRSVISEIPESGLKLADGSLVKSDSSGSVYGVFGGALYLYTSSAFEGFSNNWQDIESYPNTALAQYSIGGTVTSVFPFEQNALLVSRTRCYTLDASLQARLGINLDSLKANTPYNQNIFPNFDVNDCLPGSKFIKKPSSPLVYLVENGQKRPITTWNKLLSETNGQEPYVIVPDPAYTDSIPTGTEL